MSQPPLPPTQFGVITSGSTPQSTSPTNPGTNKVLGSIAWATGGTMSKTGTDTTIGVIFTGVDTFNNVEWVNYNPVNSTYNYVINPSSPPSDNKLFSLQPGVNTFKVRGDNPDNNQVYYTNVLTYTKSVPAYVISPEVSQTFTPSIGDNTGTVTVNVAPVTLTLTANASGPSSTFGTINARGYATISLLGTEIFGSPFNTPFASNTGTPTTTISIVLPSIGVYDVYINTDFFGSSGLGTVKLT